MFYSYSILAAKIASTCMLTEYIACPLEARVRGPIECFINFAHYGSVERVGLVVLG